MNYSNANFSSVDPQAFPIILKLFRFFLNLEVTKNENVEIVAEIIRRLGVVDIFCENFELFCQTHPATDEETK